MGRRGFTAVLIWFMRGRFGGEEFVDCIEDGVGDIDDGCVVLIGVG